jgi:hypothetical protein
VDSDDFLLESGRLAVRGGADLNRLLVDFRNLSFGPTSLYPSSSVVSSQDFSI